MFRAMKERFILCNIMEDYAIAICAKLEIFCIILSTIDLKSQMNSIISEIGAYVLT